MQPENQPGVPVPSGSQAPQPLPQQPQSVPPITQAQSPVVDPRQQQPLAPLPRAQVQPPIPRPIMPQPSMVAQPLAAEVPPAPVVAETLGSVAVANQIDDGYGYVDELSSPETPDELIDVDQAVTWRAQEYIHQEKGAAWFAAFAGTFIVFMGMAIFLMKSISFAFLLVVIAVVIIILAKRPPREMEYALSDDGLHIDNTLHKYADFKSFGVIRDGEEFSIMLIPRRRFQPGITVYFPEEAGEAIVDALGSRLPMRDLRLDAVDKLVRKLRL